MMLKIIRLLFVISPLLTAIVFMVRVMIVETQRFWSTQDVNWSAVLSLGGIYIVSMIMHAGFKHIDELIFENE